MRSCTFPPPTTLNITQRGAAWPLVHLNFVPDEPLWPLLGVWWGKGEVKRKRRGRSGRGGGEEEDETKIGDGRGRTNGGKTKKE